MSVAKKEEKCVGNKVAAGSFCSIIMCVANRAKTQTVSVHAGLTYADTHTTCLHMYVMYAGNGKVLIVFRLTKLY